MRTTLLYSSLITLFLATPTAQAERFSVEHVLESPIISQFANEDDSSFGDSADQDGDTAVVADLAAARVEVFTRQADRSWQHTQTITAPVGESYPISSNAFAYKVAIEGDTIAISDIRADGDQDIEADAGIVYLYRRQAEGQWSYETILGNPVDITAASYDHFGSAIAIENGVMVIGASGDEVTTGGFKVGSAFLYKLDESGRWNFDKHLKPTMEIDGTYLGSSIATDGTRVIIGGPTSGGLQDSIGVVYIYEVDGDTVSRFTTPATGEKYTIYYGRGVDIRGDFAFVGAPLSDTQADDSGIVYVYKYNGNSWEDFTSLDWYGLERLDGFGYSLDFDGTDLIVSSSGYLDRVHYFQYDNVSQQFNPVRSWHADNYVNFDIGEELGMQNVHITSSGSLVATANDQVFIYESEAQLELVIQDNTDPVTTDNKFSYSLMLSNNDAEVTATDILVHGALPPGFTLVKNDVNCSANESSVTTITCSVDSLEPLKSHTFEVKVSAADPGSFTFSADVEFNEWPAEGSILSATEDTTVELPEEGAGGNTGSDSSSGAGTASWLLLALAGLMCRRLTRKD